VGNGNTKKITRKNKEENKMRPNKYWIQEAVQHEGALRQYAARQGMLTSQGTINTAWLHEMAQRRDVIGHRARLALTLKRLRQQK
jgi:hypothetical protein